MYSKLNQHLHAYNTDLCHNVVMPHTRYLQATLLYIGHCRLPETICLTWLAPYAKVLCRYVKVFLVSSVSVQTSMLYSMFTVPNYRVGAKKHILIPVLYQSCEVPTFMDQLYYLSYPRYKDNQQQCQKYFWKRLYEALA